MSSSELADITDAEREEADLWAKFGVAGWHNAVSEEGSTFSNLYRDTTAMIHEELKMNTHDVILEVGCGTGEVIGSLTTTLPRIGIDINPLFVEFCDKQYPECKFEVVDATELVAWWKSSSYKDFKNPLVLCCNNTMNIIPQSIRYRVIQEMRELCGTKNSGRVLVSYWNGNYFSHGVANFYLKNPALCGEVDVHNDIDWKNNSMMTKTGYFTQWQKPDWVMRLLKCYDIDPVYSRSLIQEDCLITEGLGIFVWFTARTSGARDLYDSDDAQLLYSQVWGSGTMHLGRYEQVLNCPSPGKLPSDPNVLSSSIINAQQLHEDDFCAAVRAKTEHCEGVPIPCRVLDMGCGFGGLLRRLKDEGLLRNGVGVDFSAKMCKACEFNNKASNMTDVISVRNESFLDTSLHHETVDMVVSMEAFVHVGKERHCQALKEAYRVLRPGGWLLFSDIMETSNADPEAMRPIREYYHNTTFGTVEHYKQLGESIGFKSISYESHSKNVSTHFRAIYSLITALRTHPDPAKRLSVSEDFLDRTAQSMLYLADHAEGKIDWGIFIMRKV